MEIIERARRIQATIERRYHKRYPANDDTFEDGWRFMSGVGWTLWAMGLAINAMYLFFHIAVACEFWRLFPLYLGLVVWLLSKWMIWMDRCNK